MGRRTGILVVMGALAVLVASAQAIPLDDAVSGGSGGNTLVALGPNKLTVVETISPIGGGVYEYRYSFTNAEDSDLWHFVVFLHFPWSHPVPHVFDAASAPFDYGNAGGSVDVAYAPYDARNIDPSILTLATAGFGPPYPATAGVEPGGAAWLSFRSALLDPLPKLFAYETVETGYARINGGFVAAYGWTDVASIPEPATLSLLALGGLALLRRRRKR